MIEAVMFWNEPNNKSHWDFEVDPEWRAYANMVKLAAQAVAAENPRVLRLLGGMSPIDPNFICNMERHGALDPLDGVAVHGFPLDWNHWKIDEWPQKLAEIRSVTELPVWVSEVGVSSFGAEEVQDWGLQRTAELLIGRAPRIHWYSLYDLPRAWPATTRHREAEGSAYYRHFYMGILREDGTPKPALEHFSRYTPALGICQWFHFEDHRLDDAVRWLRALGVRYLRTGLSWSDSLRPGALEWFDRQMSALEEFDLTLTFCFTPEACGVRPHHTSPPKRIGDFAEFCARMTRRYAPRVASPAIESSSPSANQVKKEDHQWQQNPSSPRTTTRSSLGRRARGTAGCSEADARGRRPSGSNRHPAHRLSGLQRQKLKLRQTGIEHYFDVIVVAEDAGAAKPQQEIFLAACRQARPPADRCVYVGDRLDHDALPSQAIGMRSFWLNRRSTRAPAPVEVIGSLAELGPKLQNGISA